MPAGFSAVAVIVSGSVVLGGAITISRAQGTAPGTRRIEPQRHDLDVADREVDQSRVELDACSAIERHSHPGAEIVNVVQGSLEYRIDGRPPVTLHAEGVLFIPARTVPAARNVGRGKGVEIATYVVENGETLVVVAKQLARMAPIVLSPVPVGPTSAREYGRPTPTVERGSRGRATSQRLGPNDSVERHVLTPGRPDRRVARR